MINQAGVNHTKDSRKKGRSGKRRGERDRGGAAAALSSRYNLDFLETVRGGGGRAVRK